MSRSLSLYLNDILNSIAKIQKYTRDFDYDDLINNEQVVDAVTHNLLIIGEAVKQIPDYYREKYPDIEWRQIAGLRDVIAHTYFYINPKIIWNIIQDKLEPLKKRIQLICEEENCRN